MCCTGIPVTQCVYGYSGQQTTEQFREVVRKQLEGAKATFVDFARDKIKSASANLCADGDPQVVPLSQYCIFTPGFRWQFKGKVNRRYLTAWGG
jgi:hypothetical protein